MSDLNALFEKKVAQIDETLNRISDDIQDTRTYIRTRYMPALDSGGWGQFLQENTVPTAAGTSCIVSSLVQMGVSHRDSQVASATAFLCADQRNDGGWSKPSLADHLSLTLVTCLSLNALQSVGMMAEDPVMDKGIKWLQESQNSDGGWGNTRKDEQSDVTCTAYALRTLSGTDFPDSQLKPVLELGANWIAQQQNEDGGWGIRSGESSSLAHTSHAAEGLIAAGQTGLQGVARQWLLEHVPHYSLAPWDEHYQFPQIVEARLPVRSRGHSRLRWTHLPTQRAIIALLKLKVDPDQPVISSLITDLMAQHEKGTCWKVQTIPEAAASWAILESVNALTSYHGAMERVKQVAAFREVVRFIVPKVQALESENADISERLETLSLTVAKLSRKHRPTQVVLRIMRIMTAPAIHLALIMAATVTLLALYLTIWSSGTNDGTRLIGTATIVAPALALFEMVRRRKRRES